MRWCLATFLAAACGVCSARAAPQDDFAILTRHAIESARSTAPVIEAIEFQGLRRISALALRAQIGSREGNAFDPRQVEMDVHALTKLGWFRDARVETQSARQETTSDSRRVLLIFHLEENPFLTTVEFRGSQLLSREQIEKYLEEKNVALKTGEPANETMLNRAGFAIREALRELGHPDAKVSMERPESPNATVRVRYVIEDGPMITVGKICFAGNAGLPEKELRAQMREINPGEWFAGLRGRNIFTEGRFESERERLLKRYRDHGYPDAKIGRAEVSKYEDTSRRWLPWPYHVKKIRQRVIVPVEAGRLYKFEKIEIAEGLKEQLRKGRADSGLSAKEISGKPYSEQAVEQLRRTWFARINPKPGKATAIEFRGVDAIRAFDPESGTANVRLTVSAERPVLVERIDIRGLRRFKDRYVRRRLVLEEGKPLDERALEAGLTRLTRTGYFRPIKKEDVRVEVNEGARIAKVTLQVHEIGQQRVSLTGGQSTFGSTLGVVYSVFDLLNREELLSAQIEGGPQSALLILGLVKEGFLASRGSMAISLFDNVLRPRLAGTVKGPFYTSQNVGVNAGWSYAVSSNDALGVNYAVTRNITRYSLDVPAALTGVVASEISAKTDSRAVGVGWTHDSGNERRIVDGSVSGGWFGGNENLLRTSAEYSRIVHDPLFERQNAWAFRIYARGAGSYAGDMPVYARILAGDELVRGLRQGELGPYAASSTADATGATKYSAVPAGANVVTAANAEYRVPLREGLQAAGFFDLGSGVLLPNWLGPSRPALFSVTNGILHGSTGIELSWTVPGVHVPVRAYYALNIIGLNRFLSLPDGTVFHARNRASAFGWAAGTLF